MEPICVPVEMLDQAVQEGLHQAASVEMKDADGTIIRIYADMENKTWTLFVISKKAPNVACLRAAGDEYTRYPSRTGRPS